MRKSFRHRNRGMKESTQRWHIQSAKQILLKGWALQAHADFLCQDTCAFLAYKVFRFDPAEKGEHIRWRGILSRASRDGALSVALAK